MNRLRDLFIFSVLAATSIYCVTALYALHTNRGGESLSRLANLPAPLAQTMVLEFQGVTSDFLMLKVLTYLGQKLMDAEKLTEGEWQTVYLSLKQVVNLDARFLDPYVVAQMTLPSDAGMVKETNELLEKAAQTLTWDYRPHFFLWYNYFYYLNDPETAGGHLEKAARIPGAPTYFPTLAARTNLYAGKIYAAVVFLEETLRETSDPSMRKFLGMRLEALKKIGFLEIKVLEYKKKYNKIPENLQELVACGIITRIPSDPYGGEFYIMEGGRVYTTSKLVMTKTSEQK